MILADTSIWADHFDHRERCLGDLLMQERVVVHPYVTAEIGLGNLADWPGTMAMLGSLPQANLATQAELMTFIEGERLQGCGVGFVDANLLASCLLSEVRLWTRDRRLVAQAQRLGCDWAPA